MSTDTKTEAVAAHFVSHFYETLLSDSTRLVEVYNADSVKSFAAAEKQQVALTGRDAILEQHKQFLQQRGNVKVAVASLDAVSALSGAIVAIVRGTFYTAQREEDFVQMFVLAATTMRTNTYHVASESLRLVAPAAPVEEESASAQLLQQLSRVAPKAAVKTERPPRQPKAEPKPEAPKAEEKPEKKRRERRKADEEPKAAAPAPVEKAERPKRERKERKPQEEKKDDETKDFEKKDDKKRERKEREPRKDKKEFEKKEDKKAEATEKKEDKKDEKKEERKPAARVAIKVSGCGEASVSDVRVVIKRTGKVVAAKTMADGSFAFEMSSAARARELCRLPEIRLARGGPAKASILPVVEFDELH